MRFTRGFRDLPLFWKLLVPFFTLIVIIGLLGAFLIVRELSTRADTALDEDLSRRSLAASAALRDRELYLLESAAFAANLQGMATAIVARDAGASSRLLASVLALKTDLSLAVVTTQDGRGLTEFINPERGSLRPSTSGGDWAGQDFVAKALADTGGERSAGFLDVDGRAMLGLAAPICTGSPQCKPAGVAIVGMATDQLVTPPAPSNNPGQGEVTPTGVALYDARGRLLAARGNPAPPATPPALADRAVRQLTGGGDDEVATLFTPLLLQGRNEGTLAVSVRTESAFGSVRSAALRLALIVLAAMLGIIAIGALLSRFILAQVRPLLDALRALGAGDLSVRAAPAGKDELGELAAGVNAMAAQLQTSYEQLQTSNDTLEQRVDERTAEVQQLLRERTQFFAAMSHEFRTPVAVILSQAQMLSDPEFPKTPKWQTDAGRILRNSGEQLLSLVSDILELAKAEVGKLEVDLADVSLPALVKDLRPTIEALASSADLMAQVTVPARLPAVRADRVRLREVLLSLVDNAVKYTPGGGTVTVSARSIDQSIEIAVTDTGVGIPTEDAGRIFEPFFRVRRNRTQRGQPSSGLGLAVAKRLVEAQGGTIDFSSAPGEGSTFRVRLPLATPKRPPVKRTRPGALTS
ncbi:MAG TPA: HAMP domain-containing sensor histidine kinase [Mycobacteriales bacterium]|nr:HAMP domain-containing sensor histidine kinase [Mycobacteriales bacterium]